MIHKYKNYFQIIDLFMTNFKIINNIFNTPLTSQHNKIIREKNPIIMKIYFYKASFMSRHFLKCIINNVKTNNILITLIFSNILYLYKFNYFYRFLTIINIKIKYVRGKIKSN